MHDVGAGMVEYFPSGHAMQITEVVAPVIDSLAAVPPGQLVHTDNPDVVPNLPAVQFEHTSAPLDENRPLGQLEQTVDPIVAENNPLAHSTQLLKPEREANSPALQGSQFTDALEPF